MRSPTISTYPSTPSRPTCERSTANSAWPLAGKPSNERKRLDCCDPARRAISRLITGRRTDRSHTASAVGLHRSSTGNHGVTGVDFRLLGPTTGGVGGLVSSSATDERDDFLSVAFRVVRAGLDRRWRRSGRTR